MIKTVDGGTVTCAWRDMVLTFSRLPGMIVATGGRERMRYIGYGMTDVIRRYRKEQLESGEQARARRRGKRGRWRAMANTYTLTAVGRRTGEVVGVKSVMAATLKRAEKLAEQWENWFRAIGMYSVLVTVKEGKV